MGLKIDKSRRGDPGGYTTIKIIQRSVLVSAHKVLLGYNVTARTAYNDGLKQTRRFVSLSRISGSTS